MTTTPMAPVALADALGSFTAQWSPRIVTTINDYDVRVAKVHGEHVWHAHDNTDEFFLVITGELHIGLRENDRERTVVLPKGAVFTVPRGIQHRPFAPVPTEILVLEPSGTSTVGDRHDAVPDHIDVTTGHLLPAGQGGTASAIAATTLTALWRSSTEGALAMSAEAAVPPLVAAAAARARQLGFSMSCDPAVGRLLAVLAAHLPEGAHVLELGTGTGVSTAWIVSGLQPRTDVRVTTVEKDPVTAAAAAEADWPSFVDLRCGDALQVLAEGGTFDLIFADAPGGKWEGLDRSAAALRPHGLLVVDDMTPQPDWADSRRASQDKVRQALLSAPELTSAELACGSGVILSVHSA